MFEFALCISIYVAVKLGLMARYSHYAIDLIYQQTNPSKAEDKYLEHLDSFGAWLKFWTHPFKWTFDQYFPGLKDGKF